MPEKFEGGTPPQEYKEEKMETARTSTETAFGWAYDDQTEKFNEWARESEKNLELAKEKFLELLKTSSGKFIGVQEKGGFPLYLDKAGKQYETPSLGSSYRTFAEYEENNIINELADGAHPIFDNDVVQQGGLNPGIGYYGGFSYDFGGETIAETDERGDYDGGKEVCTVFGMPILKGDLDKFVDFARRMSRDFKTDHQYSIPEDIQQAVEALKRKE